MHKWMHKNRKNNEYYLSLFGGKINLSKHWAFLFNNGKKNTVLIQKAKLQVNGKRNQEVNISDRFGIFFKWTEKNHFRKILVK